MTIRNALAAVPKKFECVWEPTDDVTLEQLQEWEKLNNAEQDAKGPRMRLISSPLFRMDGPNITEIQKTEFVKGRDEFAKRHFNYRYWEGEEDDVEITEKLERNIKNGTTKPWRRL